MVSTDENETSRSIQLQVYSTWPDVSHIPAHDTAVKQCLQEVHTTRSSGGGINAFKYRPAQGF